VSACQGAAIPAAPIERSAAGLDQVPLSVRSNGRTHRFIVEVARTLEEQNYGLMNRASLAPDRGMIFPYDPPIAVAFWMKNTLIPLDIIFIAPGGKILNIAANTTPLSLEQVPSAGPVEAVLELAGGRAAELGIEPGDQVEWAR
jgi:uncharacterized membrane protein (UPF0127 family)